jgi:hypothetical protein
MTDNEKRAHDLAIMATKCRFDMDLQINDSYNSNHPHDPKEFVFDFLTEYHGFYDSFLRRINNDFPN